MRSPIVQSLTVILMLCWVLGFGALCENQGGSAPPSSAGVRDPSEVQTSAGSIWEFPWWRRRG